MPNWGYRFRRRARAMHRRLREIEMIVHGLVSTSHPILAHLIPIRRCNLSCTYCNEYDHVSPPVSVETLYRRVDRLAELGTGIVTISGGEPLLHPEVEEVIARIRRRGMIAGMITNGYLLTAERIDKLNRAGLDHLQISIDNVMPDPVSLKSLKVLDRKLKLLSERALFHVNINSVIGAGMSRPAGRARCRPAGGRTGLQLHGRHLPRSQGPDESARRRGASGLPRDEDAGQAQLRSNQLLPGQYRGGQTQRLALPRRRALSLHLRGRAGALLLAAARVPGQTARTLQRGRHPPRVPAREGVRAGLHDFLRPPGVLHGLLARAAKAADRTKTRRRRAGASARPGCARTACRSPARFLSRRTCRKSPAGKYNQ